MSVKALGIALKLTWEGNNQMYDATTWWCVVIVAVCVATQMNYLNKALDVFNAAVVTPMYYVAFTTLTLVASAHVPGLPRWQPAKEVACQFCGFVTILCGVFTLQVTKDVELGGMGPPGARGNGGGFGARGFGDAESRIVRGQSAENPGPRARREGVKGGGGGGRGGGLGVRVNLGRQASSEGLM